MRGTRVYIYAGYEGARVRGCEGEYMRGTIVYIYIYAGYDSIYIYIYAGYEGVYILGTRVYIYTGYEGIYIYGV